MLLETYKSEITEKAKKANICDQKIFWLNKLIDISSRCGRVVTDFDWEAKNRFNF